MEKQSKKQNSKHGSDEITLNCNLGDLFEIPEFAFLV